MLLGNPIHQGDEYLLQSTHELPSYLHELPS